MPVQYKVHESGVVVATLTGWVTTEDCQRSLDYLGRASNVPQPLRLLTDTRLVLDFPFDFIEGAAYVEAISHSMGGHRFEGKIGYLATSDLMFGVLRRIQMLLSLRDINVGVFRDVEEALDWLDLPRRSDIVWREDPGPLKSTRTPGQ